MKNAKLKVSSPAGTDETPTEATEIEGRLTAPDLRLRRYLELEAEVKEKTRELESLKEEFKHSGSFSTAHFVCSVEEKTRRQAPSLDELFKAFGPRVDSMCRVVSYRTVKVTRKGG